MRQVPVRGSLFSLHVDSAMATRTQHNKNNSGQPFSVPVDHLLTIPLLAAVKRILQEARELANDPSTDYVAAPLEVRLSLSLVVHKLTSALCYCRMISS